MSFWNNTSEQSPDPFKDPTPPSPEMEEEEEEEEEEETFDYYLDIRFQMPASLVRSGPFEDYEVAERLMRKILIHRKDVIGVTLVEVKSE